ncbi:hypothetical protein Tco_0534700 [Tanacetum coccineum]
MGGEVGGAETGTEGGEYARGGWLELYSSGCCGFCWYRGCVRVGRLFLNVQFYLWSVLEYRVVWVVVDVCGGSVSLVVGVEGMSRLPSLNEPCPQGLKTTTLERRCGHLEKRCGYICLKIDPPQFPCKFRGPPFRVPSNLMIGNDTSLKLFDFRSKTLLQVLPTKWSLVINDVVLPTEYHQVARTQSQGPSLPNSLISGFSRTEMYSAIKIADEETGTPCRVTTSFMYTSSTSPLDHFLLLAENERTL